MRALTPADRPGAMSARVFTAEDAPATLVVFVDAESARLFPISSRGSGEEVRVQSEVHGHHRQGGWNLLEQSRFQRHTQHERDAHFATVVEAVRRLLETSGARSIVLAGDRRNVAVFRARLPRTLGECVLGTVRASRHEPASDLGRRAADLVARVRRQRERAEVDAVLADAAAGGRAVCGLTLTMEAVARGAVQCLYLLVDARHVGIACVNCDTLHAGRVARCPRCGGDVRTVELTVTMMERVVEAGGAVRMVSAHPGLARWDGVATRLRN